MIPILYILLACLNDDDVNFRIRLKRGGVGDVGISMVIFLFCSDSYHTFWKTTLFLLQIISFFICPSKNSKAD